MKGCLKINPRLRKGVADLKITGVKQSYHVTGVSIFDHAFI